MPCSRTALNALDYYGICDIILFRISQMLHTWLLLLHQIPPAPPYFRAKVLRRLNNLGALAIKNSAYLLPETNETKEDFEWIRSEIVSEGGEAWLFSVRTVIGQSDEVLRESFQGQRSENYKQLLESCLELQGQLSQPNGQIEAAMPLLRKLNRRLDEIRKIDYFHAPYREEVEEAVMKIEQTIESRLRGAAPAPVPKPVAEDLVGRTWVTRRGVKVDRIATAWLIRRFIDPQAKFIFADERSYVHRDTATRGDAIRFDMFDGEFSHEGALCTFEVLLQHVGLADPGLQAIAEAVHDIDLKDERYQRPETKGLAAMIDGIVAMRQEDEQRVEEGSRMIDAFYAAFRARKVEPR